MVIQTYPGRITLERERVVVVVEEEAAVEGVAEVGYKSVEVEPTQPVILRFQRMYVGRTGKVGVVFVALVVASSTKRHQESKK